MRKVVLYQLMSLDGVAEEPGNWMFGADNAMYANLATVIGAQTDVLLGRGTYDYWSGYWPSADDEPFASFINGTTKHVFTSTKPDVDWPNSTYVDGPAEEYVAELKQGNGGDIGIHGSIRLAQSLIAAGLVDELRLVVSPALADGGREGLNGIAGTQRWELLDSATTSDGQLLLGYRLADQT
jgi:dihydrofolate reductase